MKISKKITIILTDDDEEDRDFFQYAILDLKIDYNLLLFSSGQELIDYLNNDNDIPDIVFLDLNMPGMSGFEALEKIRADKKFNKIPVIAIYSTSSNEADKLRSLQYGANTFITKPNNFSELKKLLNSVISAHWQIEHTAE